MTEVFGAANLAIAQEVHEGFDVWNTGGGCMAFGLVSADESVHVLVSEDWDHGGGWLVGCYDQETGNTIDEPKASFAALADACTEGCRLCVVHSKDQSKATSFEPTTATHEPDAACACDACFSYGRQVREKYKIKGGLGGMGTFTPANPHPDVAWIPELGGKPARV